MDIGTCLSLQTMSTDGYRNLSLVADHVNGWISEPVSRCRPCQLMDIGTFLSLQTMSTDGYRNLSLAAEHVNLWISVSVSRCRPCQPIDIGTFLSLQTMSTYGYRNMSLVADHINLWISEPVFRCRPCQPMDIGTFLSLQVFDGWVMNWQPFPSAADHQLTMVERSQLVCGKQTLSQAFMASQNVAMLNFVAPRSGQGFRLKLQFITNQSRE